jgi:hypothetical protein
MDRHATPNSTLLTETGNGTSATYESIPEPVRPSEELQRTLNQLFETNEPAEPSLHQQIQSTLIVPESSRLQFIQKRRLQLRDQMRELKRLEADSLSSIAYYRSAISNLRVFPTEILENIFVHLDGDYNDKRSLSTLWFVSRVCKRWRDIVFHNHSWNIDAKDGYVDYWTKQDRIWIRFDKTRDLCPKSYRRVVDVLQEYATGLHKPSSMLIQTRDSESLSDLWPLKNHLGNLRALDLTGFVDRNELEAYSEDIYGFNLDVRDIFSGLHQLQTLKCSSSLALARSLRIPFSQIQNFHATGGSSGIFLLDIRHTLEDIPNCQELTLGLDNTATTDPLPPHVMPRLKKLSLQRESIQLATTLNLDFPVLEDLTIEDLSLYNQDPEPRRWHSDACAALARLSNQLCHNGVAQRLHSLGLLWVGDIDYIDFLEPLTGLSELHIIGRDTDDPEETQLFALIERVKNPDFLPALKKMKLEVPSRWEDCGLFDNPNTPPITAEEVDEQVDVFDFQSVSSDGLNERSSIEEFNIIQEDLCQARPGVDFKVKFSSF